MRYAGLATQLAAQQAANAVSNVVQANAAKTTAQAEFAKRMDAINERLATERTVFAKSAASVNLTPNLGVASNGSTAPFVDNPNITATWNPKMPVVGYNAGDSSYKVNSMVPPEQETDYWERPNGQAEREAFAGLLENVDKYVFAHVRSFKDSVLGAYEKSNAVYNRECERLGVQPNLTNPVYAAPMFAKAAMSLIPDTLGETAFVGVAGAATKPLLFAGAAASKTLLFTGNKAFNYGAKTLGYTGTTSGTKLVYSAVADGVAGARGAGVSVSKNELIFSRQVALDFLPTGYLDGQLYPKDKLPQLVAYLEKRNVNVIGTYGSPGFRSININTGKSEIHLPESPTVLQVKHELSHWLDCKRLGIEEYNKLSILQKEQMVLDRLQGKEEFWKQLTTKERDFSKAYVQDLKPDIALERKNGVKNAN